MEDENVEIISEEHLKTILTTLSPEDIVKPAYDNWTVCQKSGYTILNLENGKVYGLGVEPNQLPLIDMLYITLYTIEALEDPVKTKDLFSKEEFEEYEKYKGDDPTEYAPDIVSDFCRDNDIDEDKRKIDILADRFEENEYFNYNKWETGVLNEYYDTIQEQHYTYKSVDEEV